VRFWRSPFLDSDGRPVWVGAAIFDERVGFSHTTGQVTHHTAPDVDAERDYLFHDLEQTGDLSEFYIVDGFHKILEGVNGGGDPWHTDGNLYVGVIARKVLWSPAVPTSARSSSIVTIRVTRPRVHGIVKTLA
jgi:hypothetical protein